MRWNERNGNGGQVKRRSIDRAFTEKEIQARIKQGKRQTTGAGGTGRSAKQMLGGFSDRSPELIHSLSNLLGYYYRGWRNEEVIAGDAVHAPLHGIYEKAALSASFSDPTRKISVRRERLLGFLVSNKFNSP